MCYVLSDRRWWWHYTIPFILSMFETFQTLLHCLWNVLPSIRCSSLYRLFIQGRYKIHVWILTLVSPMNMSHMKKMNLVYSNKTHICEKYVIHFKWPNAWSSIVIFYLKCVFLCIFLVEQYFLNSSVKFDISLPPTPLQCRHDVLEGITTPEQSSVLISILLLVQG